MMTTMMENYFESIFRLSNQQIPLRNHLLQMNSTEVSFMSCIDQIKTRRKKT